MLKMISKKIEPILSSELTEPVSCSQEEKLSVKKKNVFVHSFAELVEMLAEKETRQGDI